MSATGGVEIQLGGRTRTLRYTNKAFMKLDDALGRMRRNGGEPGNITMTNLTLWAGLLHEDPSLTLEQVVEMVEPYQYDEIGTATTEAILASQQKPGTEAQENDAPKAIGLTA